MRLVAEWRVDREFPSPDRLWHYVRYEVRQMEIKGRMRETRTRRPIPCGLTKHTYSPTKKMPSARVCPECREFATRLIVERV